MQLTFFARPVRAAIGVLAVAALAGCGGDASGPNPDPQPEITVTGITDGSTYTAPVTVSISVDRGSYTATLDGVSFFSGQSISTPGAHVLLVNARNGTATATREVRFTIAGAAGGAVIVRLINLGANASGGGGDAILLTDSSAAGMVHGLIDAGPAGSGGSNPGFVAQRLAALGVTQLAFLQLTHAHGDHFEGMPAVLSALRPRRFVYNGQVRNWSVYNNLLAQAASRADSVIRLTGSTPHVLRLGGDTTTARVATIPPLPSYVGAHTDSSSWINEGSLGTELRQGTFRMFFTGDGEVQANARWRTQFGSYSGNVEVLKGGHHGANDAFFDNGFNSGTSWLDHTSPEAVVISANGTSHPRLNALTAILQRTNRRTYCTNVHGDIVIRITRSGSYTITPEKNAGSDCVAGSSATS